MSSSEAQSKSPGAFAEHVLARTVAVLTQWDKGVSVKEFLAGATPEPALWNVVFTLFRHRAEIDWVIGRLTRGRRVRPRLRRVLYWGSTQILFADGLAPPVVTDVCVNFVTRRYHVGEARFINAVLRRVASRTLADWRKDMAAEAPAWVRTGLPKALYRKWSAHLAPARIAEIATAFQQHAPLIVRLRAGAARPDDPTLKPLDPAPWASEAHLFQVTDPGAFFDSVAFRRGDFYVQDPSTLLAPALTAPQPDERVADLCCAPGGKAVILAEALAGGTGRLSCLDKAPHRLRHVLENLERFDNVGIAVGDARWPPLLPGQFDAVLMDVPCSNTGVLRRRPDAAWRFSTAHLAELIRLQADILDGAAPLVRAGGRLVYSTCSIEPEENADQVRSFLERRPEFATTREQALLPGPLHDGAYAAVLEKKR